MRAPSGDQLGWPAVAGPLVICLMSVPSGAELYICVGIDGEGEYENASRPTSGTTVIGTTVIFVDPPRVAETAIDARPTSAPVIDPCASTVATSLLELTKV